MSSSSFDCSSTVSLASESEYCPFVVVVFVVVIEVAVSSLVATTEVVEDMFKYCLEIAHSSLNHGCSKHSDAERRSLETEGY